MCKISNYSWHKFSVTLILFIFFSANSYAKEALLGADSFIEKSKKLSLHEKPYWKILLHYNGDESSIIDDHFFFTKDGYKNPESELNQTIKEFFRTDIALDDNHPICKYPARLKWIKQELNISSNALPKANCDAFKTYLKKTSPHDISIIFASENVNNLMSMMGHIFLKISGIRDGVEVSHSLGYFANYSAVNTPAFIFGAIFSGAPGVYILEPYHKKLAEYNDHQKRSVWEYKLKFTQDQIDNLALHIWEMKRVNAKYNFITHNCGSALLYLLYIADPKLQKIYNPLDAPIDIIKNLNDINYIKNIDVFPADNYKFRMISNNFSSNDRKIIKEFLADGNIVHFNKLNSSQEKSNVLYGAKTILNYKLANKDLSRENYDLLYKKIEPIAENLPPNNLLYYVKNPLNKSKSSRLSLGYKNQGNDKNVVNFGFYPVYNNLNGNNSEYFNEFELQLMNLEGNYYTEHKKVRIDNIDLIKIKNIISYDSLINGLSGSFKINMERERFDSKSNKMFPNLNFGIGIGEEFFGKNILLYSMINFGYSHFQSHDIAYSNPEAGIIFKENKFGKLTSKYTKYFSSNSYKYHEIIALDQTFFVKENNDIVLSFKNNKSGIEKNFRTISLEYQYHF